jgi:TonB family protein
MFKLLPVTLLVLATAGFQIQKRTCDHPAPPEGMHYVCAPENTCNCHLEKDAAENEEPTANPGSAAENQPCSADKVKYFVVPAYPEAARKARKQATITAHLTIQSSGAANVDIESPDSAFAEAVRAALHKWRFAPSATGETLTATFTFALAGNPSDRIFTTVSGASPLNLVISAPPPLH